MGNLVDEPTLDPDTEEDWESLRALGHQAMDDMIDYLKNVRDREVWKPIPSSIKESLNEPLPFEGTSRIEIYKQFKETILPYPPGNIHPRFWGWVNGAGSPFGLIADLLSSGLNSNTGGREHMPKYVEEQVIKWMKELYRFPETSSGLLTTGCSEANLIALTIARNTQTEYEVRKTGLSHLDKQLTVYCSTSTHSSLQKAIEIIGLGTNSMRFIPTNHEFQIDTVALRKQIQTDITAGFLPICIIANVGTVNTGAIDDLTSIHEICVEFNLWFHIDGAFGAILVFSKSHRDLRDKLNLADSISFDFHKWLNIQYEVGCLLVKQEKLHLESFSLRPSYLAEAKRGLASGGRWITEYGIQLSRNFRALKVWMLLKEHGINKYGEIIDKNLRQAKYFESLVIENPNLEILVPVRMNIVCFRYINSELGDLDSFNQELLIRLQESGKVVPSNTTIDGKFSLRIAITNQRSITSDFDIFRDVLIEEANRMIAEY